MPIVTRHEYDPDDSIDQYLLAMFGVPGGPYVLDAGPKAGVRFRWTGNVRKAAKFSLAADAMAFMESEMRVMEGACRPVRVRTPATATPAEMLD